jgi:hypothetical protein
MNYTSKDEHEYPEKARWKYSDEELMASAARFKHRSEWKHEANQHYQAAFFRGISDKCCAHMSPASNPYAGDYIVYAYEFADNHVYVGLTFRKALRHAMHMQRGPVWEHMKLCPEYTYKVLEHGIANPDLVGGVEDKWQAKYIADGWTPLWKNKAGGLGTLQAKKWSKEAVMAEARKYKTKQEWIDGSQMSYRIAKREGWFDVACAHMPKRVLGIGAGVAKTPEAREKMRQAKLGKQHTPEMKAARSEATRKWWAARKAGPTVESAVQAMLD